MTSFWKGKSALITGAASGIGLQMSRELVSRGVRLWMTDIDSSKLEKTAASLGDRVRYFTLDVRDAEAFRRAVSVVAKDAGSLDFLFNNAGTFICCETRELRAEHFDHIIDVNIRGVVNGTTAAYPLMISQGYGHIVNMGSLSGLMPAPLFMPYGMTKHAVVGLSTSLRLEAKKYGVRVTAICPGGVETPLLDSKLSDTLPPVTWYPDIRRYLSRMGATPCGIDVVVKHGLRGVERNRGIIVMPASARFLELCNRFMPGVIDMIARWGIREELGHRPPSA